MFGKERIMASKYMSPSISVLILSAQHGTFIGHGGLCCGFDDVEDFGQGCAKSR
jgi:hypothetical protein